MLQRHAVMQGKEHALTILEGKIRRTMDDAAFAAFAKPYQHTVIDVGTGDGKNIYKNAKNQPDTLFIGLDAAGENMIPISQKLLKKPSRGGLNNVLLVIATAQEPPSALQRTADMLTVYFPWGSLLSGLILAEPQTLHGLRSLCNAHATFEFVTTYADAFEAAEIQKRALPTLSRAFFLGEYAQQLRHAGFCIDTVDLLDNTYAAQFESAWAKRLAHGRQRDFYRITGHICTCPVTDSTL